MSMKVGLGQKSRVSSVSALWRLLQRRAPMPLFRAESVQGLARPGEDQPAIVSCREGAIDGSRGYALCRGGKPLGEAAFDRARRASLSPRHWKLLAYAEASSDRLFQDYLEEVRRSA